MQAQSSAPWIFAFAMLVGCSASPGTAPVSGIRPEFASLQASLFTPSCATASCHAGANPRGGLSLEEGKAYAALVGVEPSNGAAKAAGKKRVAAGDPAKSFLLHKIDGTASGAEGGRMPLRGEPLPAESIEAVKAWIAAGAKP